MTDERRRVLLLVGVMAAVAALTTLAALASLYRSTLATQRQRLADLVTVREALVDAVHEATGDAELTLELLARAQGEAPSLGRTGEFTVARREGDEIVFLVPLRHAVGGQELPRLTGGDLAEPMARALAGERGTMVGRDYRGEVVLAAYRPVDRPGWGLVAKIDLAEVRAPILRAGGAALGATALLVALGTFAFTRVTSPMLRRLEDSEARFRAAFEQAAVGIAHVGTDGSWLRVNQRLCQIVGYPHEELLGLTFQDITHPDDLGPDLELVEQVLAGEIPTYALEVRYLRKSGETVWVNITVSLVRTPEGEPAYFISVVEDVDDRKRAELALRERMKELRCLFGLSRLLEQVDRPWEEVLGEVPGLLIAGWQHPEAAVARVTFDGLEAASPGYLAPSHLQRAEIAAGGTVRGVVEVGYPETMPGAADDPFLAEERELLDEVARRLGEAAARREAVATLRDNEERFRSVFERSQVGKSLTAPDGRLLQVNPAFAEMLGYAVEELQALDFARVTHPDDLAASRECVRCLLAGEQSSYRLQKRYLHRDGSVVWTDVSTSLLRDEAGAPLYFMTTVIDVTERVEAQRELLAEKAFSETMLASLPGVAYLFDEELRFHRWNQNFLAVTGYTAEEFARLSPLDLFSEAEGQRVVERIAEVFSAGESSVEAELRTRDGRLVPYFFTGRLAQIGGRTFVLGVGVDISRQRRLERELRELNLELESRVAERTRELAGAVDRLAAANRELEAFSYSVSHDLRAPLRAIDGFSRILVDEHGEGLGPDARRYLGIVRDNTRTMGQLIDDLLAFSRMSRQAMRREPVALREVVEEAWAELEAERDGRRVELALGELPTVEGDPRLLKVALANLLGNALKFTRPREDARIEVGTQPGENGEVVFVRDNGVGFDMRYQDKLFGMFQRLHRADEFEGTGVGLATVARVLHRHGGRVWAEGEPGRGATFYLSFDGGDHDGSGEHG